MANVQYSTDFAVDEKHKLMEIPPELVQHIQEGSNISFKGDESEAIVLCTDDATFSVKVASTSNTLYITDAVDPEGSTTIFSSESPACNIVGSVSSYLELVSCPPRVEKLKILLSKCPYRGNFSEADSEDNSARSTSPLSWQQLVDQIQASDAEIRSALELLHAFELDGCWRLLDDTYATEKFSLILTSAVAEGWDLGKLSIAEVTASLEGHDTPLIVVQVLLKKYGTAVDVDGKTECYALSMDEIMKFEAIKLLKMNARWPFDDFWATWSDTVPDGAKPRVELLAGIGLVYETETGGREKEVVFYPANELSSDPKTRMAELFKFKSTWTADDISPYLSDVAVGGLTVEKILFKFARNFTDKNGVKMFNKR
eukprot:m.444073 g.444073  ORF g.444073 m.444073 type:complete len:371 (-) comp21486_c0_seq2:856-1968(-)